MVVGASLMVEGDTMIQYMYALLTYLLTVMYAGCRVYGLCGVGIRPPNDAIGSAYVLWCANK